VEIGFVAGHPVSLILARLSIRVSLVRRANDLAGSHAFRSAGHHREPVVGIKSREMLLKLRDCWLLIRAHQELAKAPLAARCGKRYTQIESTWAGSGCIKGLWFGPLKRALRWPSSIADAGHGRSARCGSGRSEGAMPPVIGRSFIFGQPLRCPPWPPMAWRRSFWDHRAVERIQSISGGCLAVLWAPAWRAEGQSAESTLAKNSSVSER